MSYTFHSQPFNPGQSLTAPTAAGWGLALRSTKKTKTTTKTTGYLQNGRSTSFYCKNSNSAVFLVSCLTFWDVFCWYYSACRSAYIMFCFINWLNTYPVVSRSTFFCMTWYRPWKSSIILLPWQVIAKAIKALVQVLIRLKAGKHEQFGWFRKTTQKKNNIMQTEMKTLGIEKKINE